MRQNTKACCFTGHRPRYFVFGYNENHPQCGDIKRAIHSCCEMLYREKNVRTFIVGCGLGVDQWAAEEVIALRDNELSGIRLVCVAPFPHFVDRWTAPQRERLRRIWDAADSKGFVQKDYSDDAYAMRNRHMVDRSHYVIAVYDTARNQGSGTAMTVQFALAAQRQIFFIHPETAMITPGDA